MGGIRRVASGVTRGLALLGLGILLAFATATLLDGLLRGIAGRPIEAVRDLGGLVVAVAVACCFPLALLERSDISIKFVELWIGRLGSLLLDAITSIAVLVVFFLIAYEFYGYARDLDQAGETTLMLGIRKAPFWYATDAILWLGVPVQMLVALTAIKRCFHFWQDDAPSDAGMDAMSDSV